MTMTSLPFALPSRPADSVGLMHVEAVRRAPLNHFFEGLARTGLLADVEEGLHTLLAPVDAAFDKLPWAFEELYGSDALVEERIGLFEYSVARGVHSARAPKSPVATLEGRFVILGGGRVYGRYGAARVLDTFIARNTLVHVLDECVSPFPLL